MNILNYTFSLLKGLSRIRKSKRSRDYAAKQYFRWNLPQIVVDVVGFESVVGKVWYICTVKLRVLSVRALLRSATLCGRCGRFWKCGRFELWTWKRAPCESWNICLTLRQMRQVLEWGRKVRQIFCLGKLSIKHLAHWNRANQDFYTFPPKSTSLWGRWGRFWKWGRKSEVDWGRFFSARAS